MANPADAKTPSVTKDEILSYGLEYLDLNNKEFQKHDHSTLITLLKEELIDQFKISSEEACFLAEDIVNEYRSIGKIESNSTCNNKQLRAEVSSKFSELAATASNLKEDLLEKSKVIEKIDSQGKNDIQNNLALTKHKKHVDTGKILAPEENNTGKIIQSRENLEKNLAPSEEDILKFLGKKPVLSLNFKHEYYKLKDDEFTTLRGKGFYYRTFTYEGKAHKLQRGDLIRITVKKKFRCFVELLNLKLDRIEDIPLDFLKIDAECDISKINSYEDFVEGINSFRPKNYYQAKLDSEMTIFYFRKIVLTISGKTEKDRDIPQEILAPEVDPYAKKLGKNDILGQDSQGKKSIPENNLAPIPGVDIDEITGKMQNLAFSEEIIAALIPHPGDPIITVKKRSKKLKKTLEFFFSANTTGLQKKFKKCSKKCCKCANGKLHGPYWYLNYKGKQFYLGRASE